MCNVAAAAAPSIFDPLYAPGCCLLLCLCLPHFAATHLSHLKACCACPLQEVVSAQARRLEAAARALEQPCALSDVIQQLSAAIEPTLDEPTLAIAQAAAAALEALQNVLAAEAVLATLLLRQQEGAPQVTTACQLSGWQQPAIAASST